MFVGRHVLPRPFDDLALRDFALVRGSQDDDGFHRLAAMRVLGCDHARFLNRRMLVHLRLDLGRPDFEAGRIDHSFQPIDQKEVTLLIHIAKIAGAEKLLAVDLEERRLRRFLIAPIALEDLRTVLTISPT